MIGRSIAAAGAGLLLLALAPPPALAQDALSLRPGDSATILIDDGGRVLLAGQNPAGPMSAFDKAAVRELTTNHQYAIGPNAALLGSKEQGLPTPDPIAKGSIQIAFHALAGGEESVLIIENGYDRAFRYRATMHRKGGAEPTDVCLVLPERHGYEHWPYRIERLDLGSLALVPMRPGDGITCE